MPNESGTTFGRADRDLLIELRTLVTIQGADIKSLTDMTQKQISEHEIRIRKLEEDQIKYDPAPRILRYDKMLSEWESLKSNWKLLVGIGGVALTLISAFAGYIIQNVLAAK